VENAGVIDQHIDTAKSLLGKAHNVDPLLFTGHIQMGVAAVVANVCGQRLPLLIQHIANDDLGALFDKAPHSGFAHAARTAGNYCNLVL